MDDAEKLKMQSHVGILQNEYHRMMQKVDELERENNTLKAANGVADCSNFTTRILKSIADLYNNKKYSDVNILLKGRTLFGHKIVLSARYSAWGADDLEEVNFEDLDLDVGEQLVKWIYTNKIALQKEPRFLLGIMATAFKFELQGLLTRCEEALIGLVDITNCISFYVKAEEFQAEKLKHVCYELISSHWNDFTESDFREMTPRLLLDILKRKTQFPLHAAVRARRTDVVVLYLSEIKGQWATLVNAFDDEGDSALDLALRSAQMGLATSLVDSYEASVSLVEPRAGRSLLHLAVARGDEAAATFLLNRDANGGTATPAPDSETALHLACDWRSEAAVREGNARVARLLLLRREVDANAQDGRGDTALHRAVRGDNAPARQALLAVPRQVDLDRRNSAGDCVLWLALDIAARSPDRFSLPAELLSKGASPDTLDPASGDSLLQRCARTPGMLEAALFLVGHGADLDHANRRGETALHVACRRGLHALTRRLLEKGADPNSVTVGPRSRHKRDDSGISFGIQFNGQAAGAEPGNGYARAAGNPFEMDDDEEEATSTAADEDNGREDGSVSSLMVEEEEPSQRTAMHVAVACKDSQMAEIFLERRRTLQTNVDGILPDFTVRDADDTSVFGLALWCELYDLAQRMLADGGCSVKEHNEDQLSLLHQAIQRQHTQAAIFLMEHGADLHEETPKKRLTPLELAIDHDCSAITEALCRRGAQINRFHPTTEECPLWRALIRGRQFQDSVTAEVLVKAGCDLDMWHWNGESEGTLLHQAMNLTEETIVSFLVKNGCDVNAVRRPGPDGEGGEESRDGQTALHIAADWKQFGMVKVMLTREDLEINKQDVEGNTPLHLALYARDTEVVRLLLADQRTNVRLKNKRGSTPFHLAMGAGNEEAARTILQRDPSATEENDKMGRNFLHIAIEKRDMKSFFFLLTIEANVNTRVCGDKRYTPLHLAVLSGSERILRSLLLKDACVNAEAIPKATALHLAASNNRAEMIGTLVEHRADIHARDEEGNNALHLAMRCGHLESVRELLGRQADAVATNIRGRTPLHELAAHSPDRSTPCFQELLRQRPDLPLDTVEADGNSPLLIAYLKGNKQLCIALIKAGASLGCRNRHGQTIFNFKHPSNELLPKLLDHVEQEPSWCESEVCLECNAKFSLTTRRHHCRHCGRMLCARCSSSVVPILKFSMSKPERVCQTCFDYLNCRM